MEIKFKKVNDKVVEPTFSYNNAAAMDLHSAEDLVLKAGQQAVVKTGIAMAIPQGYWGDIRDRSGLAAKHGLHCLAGVIDSDYRGEIQVVLINLSKENYNIKAGDRIAQMIISKHEQVKLQEIDNIDDTKRAEGNFGSSGY